MIIPAPGIPHDDGVGLSAIIVDWGHLNEVNDRFGHLEGDAALRDVEVLMSKAIGDRGIVARYGGEESVAVLFDVSRAQLELAADRLIAAARMRSVAFGASPAMRTPRMPE